MNTTIKNCNIELLEQQKSDLEYDIIYNDNSDGFIVYDIEAGCRKTRTAEKALAKMAIEFDKQAIFVRLNNNDCRESARNINQIAGKEVAFAFNNEDLPTQRERIYMAKLLNQYPVLIITHAKYIALAKNDSIRKIFTKGRSTLVIDEFISVRETIHITLPIIGTLKQIFLPDVVLYQKLSCLVATLEDKLRSSLSNNERHFARLENGYIGKEFKNMLKLIKNNMNNEKLQNRINQLMLLEVENIDYKFLSDTLKTVKDLCEWILNVQEFYKNVCIIVNGEAYANNTRYGHWTLDNNILLDANGELQAAYELNPDLYHLKGCEPVLNHKNWTIINVPINTTSSGKENLTRYYSFIKKRLARYGQDILVVCKKSEIILLEAEFKQISYFGNIIGSNQWRDISNVAIIHTPNLNDYEYILTYLYYNKNFIENEVTLAAHKRGRQLYTQYKFDDYRFEKIRSQWITTEIYQAIKRVNRNMEYKTDCIVFINNEDVIKLLSEKLKNCNIENEQVNVSEVGYVFTKQDEYIDNLKDNSYATQFIQLLSELQDGQHQNLSCKCGVYKKKTIREYLGIKNSTSFSHHVLGKSNVIEYCKIRNIDLSGQTIKLPQHQKVVGISI